MQYFFLALTITVIALIFRSQTDKSSEATPSKKKKEHTSTNLVKSNRYASVDEVTIIIKPRVSNKGIVTFYDLAGNRVTGIPTTPKATAVAMNCYLGWKTFKKMSRWVPIDADEVDSELTDANFIVNHSKSSMASAKQKTKKRTSTQSGRTQSFDFDIDDSHLNREEFLETYESKYATLTGYGRFKTPSALYIGHYKNGELSGQAKCKDNRGRSVAGVFQSEDNPKIFQGEISYPEVHGVVITERGRFMSLKLHGIGTRQSETNGDSQMWKGKWKSGIFIEGTYTREGGDDETRISIKIDGPFENGELNGEGTESFEKQTEDELITADKKGKFEAGELMHGESVMTSYEFDSVTKERKRIAKVTIRGSFQKGSDVNKQGIYSENKSPMIEPSGDMELIIIDGWWSHDISIKGIIQDGILQSIEQVAGAGAHLIEANDLVGLSLYDIINNPPNPVSKKTQEPIKTKSLDELEGKVVLNQVFNPDGSDSHVETGRIVNGRYVADEESLNDDE